jgi:Fe-S-cluster formation regulator IscX/YfhJ
MMRANYQVFCDPQFWIFVEMHQSAGKLPDFPDHLLGGGVQGMG